MKINKKLHVVLISILFIGLLYFSLNIDWVSIFDGSFEYADLQGFVVTLIVFITLSAQYYRTHFMKHYNSES